HEGAGRGGPAVRDGEDHGEGAGASRGAGGAGAGDAPGTLLGAGPVGAARADRHAGPDPGRAVIRPPDRGRNACDHIGCWTIEVRVPDAGAGRRVGSGGAWEPARAGPRPEREWTRWRPEELKGRRRWR